MGLSCAKLRFRKVGWNASNKNYFEFLEFIHICFTLGIGFLYVKISQRNKKKPQSHLIFNMLEEKTRHNLYRLYPMYRKDMISFSLIWLPVQKPRIGLVGINNAQKDGQN